jgi:hypothetical protein
MAKKKRKKPLVILTVKTVACPLCGQQTDYYATAHRNKPFVDDRTYPKMCFTCYQVPKTQEQVYARDGSVTEIVQLPYSHKMLHTPEELVEIGSADSLEEAKKSVRAVKEAIKSAGLDGRSKGRSKKKPDDPECEFA